MQLVIGTYERFLLGYKLPEDLEPASQGLSCQLQRSFTHSAHQGPICGLSVHPSGSVTALPCHRVCGSRPPAEAVAPDVMMAGCVCGMFWMSLLLLCGRWLLHTRPGYEPSQQ